MMEGPLSRSLLADALSALEAKEHGLLAWGIVDAALTEAEVMETLLDFIDDQEQHDEQRVPPSVDELRAVLIAERLLLPVPISNGYRTRMAETVRVLSTLRQTFRNELWWQGRPLVLDYRFSTHSRSRPIFDHPKAGLELLSERPVRRGVMAAIAPGKLAGFQERGTRLILEAGDADQTRGVVVTAGTGSGKTYAFYLPMLAWVADSVADDPSPWLRALTLYPRKELLRDQLSNALGLTRRLADSGVIDRPISIAAWYGATPVAPAYVLNGWADGWVPVGSEGSPVAWICPYLSCPDCGSDLLWTRLDLTSGRERLECSGQECEIKIDGTQLRLTRQSIREAPADVLFTTTESLNRQLADSEAWKAFGIRTTPAPRFVLLDELHTYEGITGAQNAHLLRRYRHAVFGRLVLVGLSATLRNAEAFTAALVGLRDDQVARVQPNPDELEEIGAEYIVALRHDPAHKTSPLSTTIQTCMALSRSLDRRDEEVSGGFFGSRLFVFGDRHDTINRLLWDTLDSEGWYAKTGWLRRGGPPLTLAHLRSEHQQRRPEQMRVSSLERLDPGQWWWHAEQIGHQLGGDQQMKIARTTSKDPGVSENADVVVATATLEVGYDDAGVGAVIQHKAPHDAARFLQRKGRAGRDALMRPWTAVVLSDFGRDRLTWQLFEQLFEPELSPQYLPIGNRYVQRIQGVYSFLDWLSIELRGLADIPWGSTWKDLSGPAQEQHRNEAAQIARSRRQLAAASVVGEVLSGGPAARRMEKHLRDSLRLSESELEAVLWSPPRSLLLAVLPTALRRLRSQWRNDVARHGGYGGAPLPEFATASLFGDLMTPEVTVTIPIRQHDDTLIETTSIQSVIAEYMPGNVSRRHSVRSPQERHWVPPPTMLGGTVDLVASYNAESVRQVTVRDGAGFKDYTLYRPRAFTLEVPPPSVPESTSVRPVWRSQIEPLGRGAALDLPTTHWSSVLRGMTTHLHAVGDGATVTRLAIRGEGRTFVDGEHQQIRIDFKAPLDDAEAFEAPPPPALGVEFEADALALYLDVTGVLPPPSRVERADRFEHVLHNHADLATVPVFKRSEISDSVLVAALLTPVESGSVPFAGDSDGLLAESVIGAMRRLELGAENEDVGDSPEGPGSSEELASVVRQPGVLAAIREALGALSGPRSGEWIDWAIRRYGTTVGAIVVGALSRLCTGVDTDDLAIDVEVIADDPTGLRVWITEMTPGGNGSIEQVHHAIASDPFRFLRLLDRGLEPTDVELLDSDLRFLLDDIKPSGPVHTEATNLRSAWSVSHAKVEAAIQDLRAGILRRRATTSRLSITSLVNRILGPGAHPDLSDRVRAIARRWDELEEECGFAVDARPFAAVELAEDSTLDELLRLGSTTDPQRRGRAAVSLLWPRGRSASQISMDVSSRFEQEVRADRAMVAASIQFDVPTLAISDTDDATIIEAQRLLSSGQLVVETRTETESLLHTLDLRLQTQPVEIGTLFAYPVLVGISRDQDTTQVRYILPEAVQ